MDKTKIGKRLQAFRQEKGYSQEELASLLGVSQTIVDRWECDKRHPTVDQAVMLARLYGITVDYLVRDTLSK